jgi:cation diffusion facilitator family transporter
VAIAAKSLTIEDSMRVMGTSTHPSSPPNERAWHQGRVKRVLWWVLGLNILVAGAKISVGAVTGAISMVADGFHSALDGLSNVIALVGLSLARRPPDRNHPYGHAKFETFAIFAIGLLLLLASWNVLKNAYGRLIVGGTPEVTVTSFSVMALTLAVNFAVTTFENHQGRRLRSNILLADAAHTRSDILVSMSVIAGLVAVKLGWSWVDATVALLIVGFIAHTGWQIIRGASGVLLDSAVLDPKKVERVALMVDGIASCHRIRSRGTGATIYLDMHVQVDGQLPLAEAHRLGHVVERLVKRQLGVSDVVVHVEPTDPMLHDHPESTVLEHRQQS